MHHERVLGAERGQSPREDRSALEVRYADDLAPRTRRIGERADDIHYRWDGQLSPHRADVTHCGPVGCGQVVKLMNNMVLVQAIVALSEARAIGRRAGVDPALLFGTLAKGSADSFALRNHGMKALLPEQHPEKAFSARYMLKDMTYALELARSAGLQLQGAGTAQRLLAETVALGLGDAYHTAILEAVRKHS